MCFKCTDMYSTKEVRIILLRSEALLSFVRVCAQEKKRQKRKFFSSLLFASALIYIPSTYRLLLRIDEAKYDERVIHEDNKSGENEIGEKAQ